MREPPREHRTRTVLQKRTLADSARSVETTTSLPASVRPRTANATEEPLADAVSPPRFAAPWSTRAFAAAMIGLGIVGLVHGDFALVWQRIPIDPLPGREAIAYACAAIELAGGIGLLIARTHALAARVLFVFIGLWLVLLKLPAVLRVPQMEATWLGFGEIAVVLAGAWIPFADDADLQQQRRLKFLAGSTGIRNARWLFIASLPMIGLSHFFYAAQTAAYVPHWLPFPLGWAYLTGAGSLAACLGLALGPKFGVSPRLVATLEAAMLGVITVLVWGPGLFALSPDRTQWTGFLISAAIACGAWTVADSYRSLRGFAVGNPR
jgi:uncharacterized membrane protein